MLRCVVQSARDLPNVEKFGKKSDPYTRLTYKGEQKKTKTIENELNPEWNEALEFDLKGFPLEASSVLVVEVKDYEKIGKSRLLGSAQIQLHELLTKPGNTNSYVLTLMSEKHQSTGATLSLQVGYVPPPGTGPPPSQRGPGDPVEKQDATDTGDGEEEDGDDEDADSGIVQGGGDIGDGGVAGKPPRGNIRKKKSKRVLSNKAQDFQVRVRIIEGRQLAGNNIKPVVRVSVAGQNKRTRIKKGNNPYFDETFFLNFHESPRELFDEVISIRAFNATTIRADSEIGGFKIDIGTVYDEQNHAFLRKWLLLSDPEDLAAGARGYLKVSLFVLATGDEAPVEKKVKTEDEEDIENNLLRPAGVNLRGAVFSLRVYRAEDVPQMDDAILQGVKEVFGMEGNKKNLVDPFLEVTFAGKKECTRIIQKNANPEWNEVLNLPVRFPSMCERMKLTLLDWDRLSHNDTIGTAFLSMSKISFAGGTLEVDDTTGFLPTFGPCYINLYGSLREFSSFTDKYEDLNLGKGEGMSYRGRVLIELITQLDAKVDLKVEPISNDDLLRVEKYMRRRKFNLYAAFYTASMMQPVDDAVQFEVSIGNYGNKFDSTCMPLASTTQYSRSVFDGCQYYFLPWANTKPVVTLTSYWEDINHRLQALNILLYTYERLDLMYGKLKMALDAKLPQQQLASVWLSLIDQVLEDCSIPMPPLDGCANVTPLDVQRRKLRMLHLNQIVEGARRLRNEATEVDKTIPEIEDWLDILRTVAEEPQNSLPDVVVWMVCGEKRVAYARIPAHEVLYSSKGMRMCGKYCGRTRTIFLKYPEDKTTNNKIPVQLRIRMWLGMAADEKKLNESSEGKLTVFAETYENQCKLFGNWGTKGLTRHKWTDVTGKIKLKKETFLPPIGWKWDGDWYIDPERSLLMDADAGHSIFADEVFENENRIPGRDWQLASDPYTDVNGDKTLPKAELEVPAGWILMEDWSVDLNRAVDEDGWEYGLVIPPETRSKQWVSAEKMYHMYRRRRWLRRRRRDPKQMDIARQKMEKLVTEGWEYASLFGWKFHLEQKSTDTQRRRRWRRCMAPAERLGQAAVFALEGALGGGGGEEDDPDSSKDDKDEKSAKSVLGVNTPTISCIFDKPHKYHLRCYIYQARDLVAMDKESFSDPYAVVSFLTQSQKTETIKTTLNPIWDQTLIFHDIDIYGDPSSTVLYSPSVVVEVFDFDTFGKDEFMGRAKCTPLVKLSASDDLTPKLAWYPLQQGSKDRGELLAAFELIKKEKADGSDLPFPPPKRNATVFMVPQGIKPVLQRTKIEILAWGLRNLKSYQLLGVTSPSLVIECGGVSVQSPVIKNVKKNPNFSSPVLNMEVRLPKEEIYTPPIIIKVIDNRQFGRKPVVAQLTVKELEDFRCDPDAVDGQLPPTVGGAGRARASSDVMLNIASDDSKPLLTSQFFGNLSFAPSPLSRATPVSPIDEKETVDWWSKFYASLGEVEKCGSYLEEGNDTLKIYDTMLEEVPEFQYLNDFCRTFKLYRGKADDDSDDPSVVGEFKGSFKIYPLPDDPAQPSPPAQYQQLPDIGLQECIVRVYIVQALALQPKDTNGLCDPYIKINLGRTTIDDHDKYIPNTLNPVFGRMFELTCTLPLEKDLKISVFDYDMVGRDEKIGETFIDLENRYLSRFGARCGLSQSYCVSGQNQWRDQMTPSMILEGVARAKSWPQPIYEGDRLTLKGRDYLMSDFEAKAPTNPHLGPVKERLALHLLRSMGLIPEHVETRTLEHSIQPGLEQGKLMMWVDVFPKNMGPPGPPFDITPRKAKKYQLRCIIWNTKDVILDETSITGEKMSDIYVKGWIDGRDDAKQKTDVHYRSLGGEGNFNWRYIFPFEYVPAENICVVSRKEHFWSLDKTELRLPPKFTIQIWDNDKFSPDDYLGYLDLNLSHMPVPAKSAEKCSLEMVETPTGKKKHKTTSLFEQKNVKGWWPCIAEEDGKKIIAGKVEMTLEILADKEAEERPAGLGREEPNMNPKLDPPNRPETSFLWFTSPLKTFKYIIWRRYKWIFIGLLILLFVVLFLAILFYSLPNYTAQKIVLG
uniref:Myoferlin-like isoform X1 n=1 Tax=Petromyzon marinus TaxID=7757 RepID=A0AAJ7T089_PETMA|nr:myoferlin-like isoform X1 [Petromyzon marinus]